MLRFPAVAGRSASALVKVTIFIFSLCLLAACGPQPARPTVKESEGSPAQRVSKATQILSKYCTLPSPLVDAHMAEEVFDNSRGWVPGPSDSHIYGVLTVSEVDLHTWKAFLSAKALTNAQTDLLPVALPTWWPASFANAEYFEPEPLIGRHLGWVAVLAPSNLVFYAFDP
jgi:hypothetical protein